MRLNTGKSRALAATPVILLMFLNSLLGQSVNTTGVVKQDLTIHQLESLLVQNYGEDFMHSGDTGKVDDVEDGGKKDDSYHLIKVHRTPKEKKKIQRRRNKELKED